MLLLETSNRTSMSIGYRYVDVDQLYIYLERGFRLSLGGSLLRARHRAGQQQYNQRCEFSHSTRAVYVGSRQLQPAHLDASSPAGLPWARRISSGKGSPSAHTAPSSKYSFFQIGTVRLSVSISQRQASNAAARCSEATT